MFIVFDLAFDGIVQFATCMAVCFSVLFMLLHAVLGILCYIRQSRIADFASLCAKNCLPPQSNLELLVYGEAYSQGICQSAEDNTEGWS